MVSKHRLRSSGNLSASSTFNGKQPFLIHRLERQLHVFANGLHAALRYLGLFLSPGAGEQIESARQHGHGAADCVRIDFRRLESTTGLNRRTSRGKDQKKTASRAKPLETRGDKVSDSIPSHFDFLSLLGTD